jgi:hypothetical protein
MSIIGWFTEIRQQPGAPEQRGSSKGYVAINPLLLITRCCGEQNK